MTSLVAQLPGQGLPQPDPLPDPEPAPRQIGQACPSRQRARATDLEVSVRPQPPLKPPPKQALAARGAHSPPRPARGWAAEDPALATLPRGPPALWAGCSILGASCFLAAKQLIFLIDWRRGSGRGESGGEGETLLQKTPGFTPDGLRPPCNHSPPAPPKPGSPGPSPAGSPPVREERRAEVWRQPDQCARRKRDGGRGRRERPAEARGSRGEAGSRRPAPARPGQGPGGPGEAGEARARAVM